MKLRYLGWCAPNSAASDKNGITMSRVLRRSLGLTISAVALLSAQVLATTFRATQRMAGFSSDSNHYVYLESSRDTGAGIPKASIQIVDVSTSACVETGCVETRYREPDANLSTTDAENDLLRRTWLLRQSLGLTPPVAGTRLAVSSRSRTPDGTETVTVNLDNRQPMRLVLQQRNQSVDAPSNSRSAMRLEISYDGKRRSLDSLSNFRPYVLRYSIRDVYLSPDRKSAVILITTTKPSFEGVLETTLVQGFDL
jgi:predicted secreted protein